MLFMECFFLIGIPLKPNKTLACMKQTRVLEIEGIFRLLFYNFRNMTRFIAEVKFNKIDTFLQISDIDFIHNLVGNYNFSAGYIINAA